MQGSLISRKTPLRTVVATVVAVAAMLALAGSAMAASVANGDFETGTLGGFTVVNQQGSAGDWFSYSGTTSPQSGQQITAPPQGTFAATTDQNSSGSHVLYQDIVLEPNAEHTLSFILYYRNLAGQFSTPDTLDYNTFPNQQYRVDILKPSADPFSVAPDDVLATVFRTNVGDPGTLEPTPMTFDLSPYAGQTVRLRFAEVDNQGIFLASVDDIEVTAELPPPSPQCSDSLDNDNDGNTDFPDDPGCESADDDNETGTPTLSIDDVTVTEGDAGATDATFTVTRSGDTGGTSTVDFATSDGTARASDNDYGARSDTLTFVPGDTSEEVSVQVNGDTADEDDENFFVNLSNPTNATIADDTGAGTITDDDTAGITVNPTSGLTTTEAGGTDTFTVVLNSKPTSDVTIPLTSSDTTEGTVSPSSLTFTPANYDTPRSVTLTGVDDDTDDGDVAYEAITEPATSTDPNYSGRAASDVSVSNTDDDASTISISDASVKEGDSGVRDATFTVSLSAASSTQVTVDYATSDGTAKASDNDYEARSAILTFAPGDTTETMTVPVNADNKIEPDETFFVNLSGATNATISDGTGKGTIENDDEEAPPPDKPACNDGRDNDGDGRKDLNDPGCSSSQDDSERGEPNPTPDCTIRGTDDDDTLRGTEGRDVICVRGGDDTVKALGGNDIVLGGFGNDSINGGDGGDELRGGRGQEAMFGGAGPDNLYGSVGKDFLNARDGVQSNDFVNGGDDRDDCSADPGDRKVRCP